MILHHKKYASIMKLVGRKRETSELEELYRSGQAEFVAVFGRRRVGKTYLINEFFEGRLFFQHAGLSPVEAKEAPERTQLEAQLNHFVRSLRRQGAEVSESVKSWGDAFFQLERLLMSALRRTRIVIFLDELPWMDTPKSGFVTALEGFWNNFACHHKNIMLVVAGSSSSWMEDVLINAHGGLYGRVTYEIRLRPFSLGETEAFLRERGVRLSRYDITQAYMILGGIPFYLNYLKKGKSLAQSVDEMFFGPDAKLSMEFDRLFASLFTDPKTMSVLIRALFEKSKGLTRKEIIDATPLEEGGKLSTSLEGLIRGGFIEKYCPLGESKREPRYRLCDPFCGFFLRFVDGNRPLPAAFWQPNVESRVISTWRGFAFENVCLLHVEQIKRALGVSGVSVSSSIWSKTADEEGPGAQIDLVLDRADGIVDMCEAKFYSGEFSVNEKYANVIQNRVTALSVAVPKKKAIHSVLVTTKGLKYGEYSGSFDAVVVLDDLFVA